MVPAATLAHPLSEFNVIATSTPLTAFVCTLSGALAQYNDNCVFESLTVVFNLFGICVPATNLCCAVVFATLLSRCLLWNLWASN